MSSSKLAYPLCSPIAELKWTRTTKVNRVALIGNEGGPVDGGRPMIWSRGFPRYGAQMLDHRQGMSASTGCEKLRDRRYKH